MFRFVASYILGRGLYFMKVNHILYKVNDLKKSVEYFRSKGFTVEYGSEKNPNDALIYFPEGPYIELIHDMNMPWYLRLMLRLCGKGKFVNGMLSQERAEEGFIRFCFECKEDEVDSVSELYKKYGRKIMRIKVKRKDTKGRELCCNTVFPYEAEVPFVKSVFAEENELHHVKHKNGAKRVVSFDYRVQPKDKEILFALNSDPMIRMEADSHIESENGIGAVYIETEQNEVFRFQ